MNNSDNPQQQAHYYNDEIDLAELLRILLEHWRMIVFGTLIVTILVGSVTFVLPRTYHSEGFYQLGNPDLGKVELGLSIAGLTNSGLSSIGPGVIDMYLSRLNNDQQKDKDMIGMPSALYKKRVPILMNIEYFQSALTQRKDSFPETIISILSAEKEISKWIEPLEYSKSILGLELSYEADTPEKARDCVHFLGQHIRDSLIYITLNEYVINNSEAMNFELNKIENLILNLEFTFQSNLKKIMDIKAILKNYPDSGKIENQQRVSVLDDEYPYLLPVMQLLRAESDSSEQRRNIETLERQKEKLFIFQEFYNACKAELNSANKNGEVLFSLLKSIKEKVLADKDFSKSTVQEVENRLNIDMGKIETAFSDSFRFISGPTLPEYPIAPKKKMIVILTFFLSGLFFIFLSFCLSWWKNKSLTRS
jgi:hypothetical protein